MTTQAFVKGRSLRQNTYHGIILDDEDSKNQGRYKVHIPELQHLIEDDKGIYIKNQNHKWRYTPSKYYMYGTYLPLQEGTLVIVKFYEDDLNTGFIDRVISDQIEKSQPHLGVEKEPKSTKDRDDIHVIFKTPKYHNALMIFEDTEDNGLDKKLIPNSIHLYYNMMRTSMIINEEGIHWFTMDNYGITVAREYQKWVMGDANDWVCGARSRVTNKEEYVAVVKDKHTTVGKQTRFFSKKSFNVQSDDLIAMDADEIYLNSDRSMKAETSENSIGADTWGYTKKVRQKPYPKPKQDKPDLEYQDNDIAGSEDPDDKYL